MKSCFLLYGAEFSYNALLRVVVAQLILKSFPCFFENVSKALRREVSSCKRHGDDT